MLLEKTAIARKERKMSGRDAEEEADYNQEAEIEQEKKILLYLIEEHETKINKIQQQNLQGMQSTKTVLTLKLSTTSKPLQIYMSLNNVKGLELNRQNLPIFEKQKAAEFRNES